MARTSFLDNAFRKNLEAALRFGTPLLVCVRSSRVLQSCDLFLSSVWVDGQVLTFWWGHAYQVQDAENYDPILNPVLNYELRRAGGR